MLREAGLDPTVVVGGKLRALGTNARLGQGDILVAEADESDGSFLMLSPTIAVVTNIDPEHLDHYGDMEKVQAAFLEFVQRVPFYGLAVLCLDNVNVRAMLPHVNKRYVTYGTAPDADWRRAICGSTASRPASTSGATASGSARCASACRDGTTR